MTEASSRWHLERAILKTLTLNQVQSEWTHPHAENSFSAEPKKGIYIVLIAALKVHEAWVWKSRWGSPDGGKRWMKDGGKVNSTVAAFYQKKGTELEGGVWNVLKK